MMHILNHTAVRTLVAMVAAAALTLAALAVMTDEVQAYNLQGCHYDEDSINPISYRFFSVSSSRERGFKDAASDWNDTSAPGRFAERSTSWDPEINVIDDNYALGSYAVTRYTCSADGTFRGNEVEIEFNTNYTLTDYKNRIVAMHELGHALSWGMLMESIM